MVDYTAFGPEHPDYQSYSPTKKKVRTYVKKHNLKSNRKVFKRVRAKLARRAFRKSLPKGRDISIVSAAAVGQIIYGRSQIGGVITCMHMTGANNWMNMIHTLACHEIDSVEKVFVDGIELSFSAGVDGWATGPGLFANHFFIRVNNGAVGNGAIGDFIGVAPEAWTGAHRQENNAHAHIILVWNAQLYGEGVPKITFQVKGKKVYDPRNGGSTGWSQNAALCIADYLTDSSFGLGVSESDIDMVQLQAEADECDESIALSGGGTEPRYTINGWFTADEAHGEIIERMSTALAGFVLYTAGAWHIKAGKYRSPVISLSLDDVRTEIDVSLKSPLSDTFNSVRGVFVDKDKKYEVLDFTSVKNSLYSSQDGKEIWEDLELPFTTSNATAQRIAKIHLEDVRQGIRLKAIFSMKAFQLEVGDNLYFTLDRYGWSNKVFEVESLALVEAENRGVPVLGIELELKETASAIYDWSEEETTTDLALNTLLPDPFQVETPSGLSLESGNQHLSVRTDGTIITRLYVTWDPPSDFFISDGGHVEIQYKKSSDTDWQNKTDQPAETTWCYIHDVNDSALYDVRIRFANAMRVVSEYMTVEAYYILGKSQAPEDISNVGVLYQYDNVRIYWAAVSDKDLSRYEVREGLEWESASFVNHVKDPYLDLGRLPSGVHMYLVAAIDTSGNLSSEKTGVTVSVGGPGAVRNLSIKNIDNNVLIDWEEPEAGHYEISHYNVYKGPTFESADFIGRVNGTFMVYMEDQAGDFTYRVSAVDASGNEGAEKSVGAFVYSPPDFVLQTEGDLDLVTSFHVNAYHLDYNTPAQGLIPVDLSHTWQSKFADTSTTTLAELYSAGYKNHIQHSGQDGYFEWEIFLGVVIPGSTVKLDWVEEPFEGSLQAEGQISYRNGAGPYVDGAIGDSFVYCKDFDTLRLRIYGRPSDDKEIVKVWNPRYRVESKRSTDTGNAQCNASGYADIIFEKDYLDVISINATARDTSVTEGFNCIVEFNDVPNPTGFRVYMYDKDGNAGANKSFSWTAEGIISAST